MTDYMDELIKKIINWGLDRNIIQGSTTEAQLGKLEEEFNELKEAVATGNNAEIRDAIGDMTVVLTIMSEVHGRESDPDGYVEGYEDHDEVEPYIEYYLNEAYDVIKDRKGKLIDGVFVKESDLATD